jgi:phosphatidylinositol glycan class T
MNLFIVTVFIVLLCMNGVESFNESLLFRPLSDGSLLIHWDFSMSISLANLQANQFQLFPKSIGQLINRYGIEKLKLSLTSGRYDYNAWGYPQFSLDSQFSKENSNKNLQNQHNSTLFYSFQDAELPVPNPEPGPNGGELFASLFHEFSYDFAYDNSNFRDKSVENDPEKRWIDLQHSLSGIFCASLHQIGSIHTSKPEFLAENSNSTLFYGILPRENVCTENLTPWVKLLPCRNQAGLAKLLHSVRLFDSLFNSIQISILPIYSSANSQGKLNLVGYNLVLSNTVVQDPRHLSHLTQDSKFSAPPSFSLSKLFAESTVSACKIAHNSAVFLHLQPWLAVTHFPHSIHRVLQQFQRNNSDFDTSGPHFTISELPSAVDIGGNGENKGNYLLFYNLTAKLHENTPFQLAVSYHNVKSQLFRFFSNNSTLVPLKFSRFFTGLGSFQGDLHVSIVNRGDKSQNITYFDNFQWFLKLFWHTLTVKIVENYNNSSSERVQLIDPWNSLHSLVVRPSSYRSMPSQLEFRHDLCGNCALLLQISVEKSFLTINNDYPPDVSRGFDLGSGVIVINSGRSKNSRVYTDGALILLPFPDNSMPFNVIAFSSTVLAFFFGSLFNLLYSGPVEIMEREKRSWGKTIKEKLSKLYKRKQ